MRAALLLALSGAAVAAAILVARDSGRPPRRGERTAGDASEVEERLPEPPPPLAPPAEGESLEEFAARCAAGGREAVAALLEAFRRGGGPMAVAASWRLEGRELKGLPTVRAACLEALRRIPGPEATEALKAAWGECVGVGESYLCALALSERQDASFAAAAFERAGPHAEPATMRVQTALVELAAAADPGTALERVAQDAPRGELPGDPQVYAAALHGLPGSWVRPAVERLLADSAITGRAKSRYLDSLFRRSDLEAVRALRDGAALLPDGVKIAATHAAVQSIAFLEDATAAGVAKANGDTRAMDAALARFEERMRETAALLDALLGPGPRTDAVRRILEERRKALPE